MKPEVRAQLSKEYGPSEQQRRAAGLAGALQVNAPNVLRLHRKVIADFDAKQGGIGWWAATLDAQRSCLIGEYLAQSVWSVHYNLLEAGAHLLELEEWWGREAARSERAVEHDAAHGIRVVHPPQTSPLDELVQPMVDLHTSGFLRAVASAIDLLGTAIVGVAALDMDLKRSDWTGAVRALGRAADRGAACPGHITRLRDLVLKSEASSGPPGWVRWAREYRNMLVHRARRLEPRQLIPRPTILGPRGQRILKTELVRHLLRDPDATEIEAWRDPHAPAILDEDASTTTNSLRDSITTFANTLCAELAGIWDTRRDDPPNHPQPKLQWTKVHRTQTSGFPGFKPGSTPVQIDCFAFNPDTARALQAGHVLDDHRHSTWQAPPPSAGTTPGAGEVP